MSDNKNKITEFQWLYKEQITLNNWVYNSEKEVYVYTIPNVQICLGIYREEGIFSRIYPNYYYDSNLNLVIESKYIFNGYIVALKNKDATIVTIHEDEWDVPNETYDLYKVTKNIEGYVIDIFRKREDNNFVPVKSDLITYDKAGELTIKSLDPYELKILVL